MEFFLAVLANFLGGVVVTSIFWRVTSKLEHDRAARGLQIRRIALESELDRILAHIEFLQQNPREAFVPIDLGFLRLLVSTTLLAEDLRDIGRPLAEFQRRVELLNSTIAQYAAEMSGTARGMTGHLNRAEALEGEIVRRSEGAHAEGNATRMAISRRLAIED